MNSIQIIVFFIVFICLVYIASKDIVKVEDKDKEKENREALEAQNEEFDYGHNVNHRSDE